MVASYCNIFWRRICLFITTSNYNIKKKILEPDINETTNGTQVTTLCLPFRFWSHVCQFCHPLLNPPFKHTSVNSVHNALVGPSPPVPPPTRTGPPRPLLAPPRPVFFGRLFLFWDLGFRTWIDRCTDGQTDTMLAFIQTHGCALTPLIK